LNEAEFRQRYGSAEAWRAALFALALGGPVGPPVLRRRISRAAADGARAAYAPPAATAAAPS
jgi:hypothetical protein